MSLLARRRAMMGAKAEAPKTNIMPSCTTWKFSISGSDHALSDNSFILHNRSDWKGYCYATPLTKRYSELKGKTIVIEFNNDKPLYSFGLAQDNVYNPQGGYSGLVNPIVFAYPIAAGRHQYKIAIGTDYTTTTARENYWITIYFWAQDAENTDAVTVSNFICYIEGE